MRKKTKMYVRMPPYQLGREWVCVCESARSCRQKSQLSFCRTQLWRWFVVTNTHAHVPYIRSVHYTSERRITVCNIVRNKRNFARSPTRVSVIRCSRVMRERGIYDRGDSTHTKVDTNISSTLGFVLSLTRSLTHLHASAKHQHVIFVGALFLA